MSHSFDHVFAGLLVPLEIYEKQAAANALRLQMAEAWEVQHRRASASASRQREVLPLDGDEDASRTTNPHPEVTDAR